MGLFFGKKKKGHAAGKESANAVNSSLGNADTVHSNATDSKIGNGETEISGELSPKVVQQLAQNAVNIIGMLNKIFMREQGIDLTNAITFSAGLAGIACHEAAVALHEPLVEVETKDGKKYYMGDSVNKYLIEGDLSVYHFVKNITDMSQEHMLAIVKEVSEKLGSPELKARNNDPALAYPLIKQCWDGIFEYMTTSYCRTPAQWPVLYAIVLENMVKRALEIGVSKEEISEHAMQCAVIFSKMDKSSL